MTPAEIADLFWRTFLADQAFQYHYTWQGETRAVEDWWKLPTRLYDCGPGIAEIGVRPCYQYGNEVDRTRRAYPTGGLKVWLSYGGQGYPAWATGGMRDTVEARLSGSYTEASFKRLVTKLATRAAREYARVLLVDGFKRRWDALPGDVQARLAPHDRIETSVVDIPTRGYWPRTEMRTVLRVPGSDTALNIAYTEMQPADVDGFHAYLDAQGVPA